MLPQVGLLSSGESNDIYIYMCAKLITDVCRNPLYLYKL